jgi:hypothetical protein
MADVHVVIYESRITAWSMPGGMVYKWAYQKRVRLEALAKAGAPKRTGALAASVSGHYDKVPNGLMMSVSADAGYAAAVHEGTLGANIRPKNGEYMRLRPGTSKRTGRSYGFLYKKRVRGQRPQPFLADALDTVIRGL